LLDHVGMTARLGVAPLTPPPLPLSVRPITQPSPVNLVGVGHLASVHPRLQRRRTGPGRSSNETQTPPGERAKIIAPIVGILIAGAQPIGVGHVPPSERHLRHLRIKLRRRFLPDRKPLLLLLRSRRRKLKPRPLGIISRSSATLITSAISSRVKEIRTEEPERLLSIG